MARILKADAERMLANVPEGKTFWCVDNRVFRNIGELGEAFGNMSDETYLTHANAEKNDFSNWVRDVIGDTKLANDLAKAANQAQAAKAASSRFTFLNSKLQNG